MAAAAKRVVYASVDIYGNADHGVSITPYFDDPDGNGIEIYWDKPRSEWPWQADGSLKMGNDLFGIRVFLAESG